MERPPLKVVSLRSGSHSDTMSAVSIWPVDDVILPAEYRRGQIYRTKKIWKWGRLVLPHNQEWYFNERWCYTKCVGWMVITQEPLIELPMNCGTQLVIQRSSGRDPAPHCVLEYIRSHYFGNNNAGCNSIVSIVLTSLPDWSFFVSVSETGEIERWVKKKNCQCMLMCVG